MKSNPSVSDLIIKRFNTLAQDDADNREQFWTLTGARVVIEDYRREYNTFRPHSRLGYQSPATFAARKNAPSPSPVGLRPPYAGDGHHNTNPLQP